MWSQLITFLIHCVFLHGIFIYVIFTIRQKVLLLKKKERMVKDILYRSRVFLVLYIIAFVFCIVVLTNYSKQDIHLFINEHNTPGADLFFKFITNIGDGLIAILISAIFLFWKYRYSIMLFSSYLISSLIAQFIKHVVCPHAIRPKAFFADALPLHFVDGVKVYMTHSFPSGHTTTVFALFLSLSP